MKIGGAWVAAWALFASTARAVAAPRTVILISVDDWRTDSIGAYGAAPSPTPNFDALARGSDLFLNAYSVATWTRPAHIAMLTSLFPSDVGPIFFGEAGGAHVILPSVVTLAQALRQEEFETAAFVDHDNLDERWGFSRGFDTYERRQHAPGAVQTARALDWLRRRKRGKAFVFLHYYDVHMANDFQPFDPHDRVYHCDTPAARAVLAGGATDYTVGDAVSRGIFGQPSSPPTAGQIATMKLQYMSCVASLDHELGEFLSGLKALGLFDDALLVIVSDHGEAFGEVDGVFAHGADPTPDILRVPLLVKAPQQRDGVTFPGLASLLDVMPTILASAAPRQARRLAGKMEGESLWELLARGRGHDAVFMDDPHRPFRAVVDAEGWELNDHLDSGRLELLRTEPPFALSQDDPRAAGRIERLEKLLSDRFREYPGY